jgi:hypothetical protein
VSISSKERNIREASKRPNIRLDALPSPTRNEAFDLICSRPRSVRGMSVRPV